MDAEGAKGRKPTNLSGKRTECGAYIGAFFSQQIFADFFLFSLQGFALPVIPSVAEESLQCETLFRYRHSQF